MPLALQVLEISYLVLLVGMLSLAGVIGLAVIARMFEPRGLAAFLRRLSGRAD